jgi:hypothetical protein
LCARRKRPRGRTADQQYEIAPSCMTRKEHSER